MSWAFDPHSGGVKIPPSVQEPTKARILAHAQKHYAGKYARLDIRFKGAFCHIDAYTEPEMRGSPWKVSGEVREQFIERMRNTPTHVCRLRYFGPERWSVAFFTYSNERYEPCFLRTGKEFGTPEEGLDVGAAYLT